MPGPLAALGWGTLTGVGLVGGALVGWYAPLPARAIAGVMAFGSGTLVAAVAYDLVGDAVDSGLGASAAGLLAGAIAYTLANLPLADAGAKHRKRSQDQQPREVDLGGSGLAIAVGALLDGVPEAVVLGTALHAGGQVPLATAAAIFLSNVPEGLSSAAGMRRAGRPLRFVLGVHGAIAGSTALAAAAGWFGSAGVGPAGIAGVNGVAGGAILAMVSDTMLPEAFEEAHAWTGVLSVAGFVAALALHRLAG